MLVESLGELDIGNHHLISAPRAALAEQLARLTPGHLAYTVFAVAGGEAIDLAIKVARGYTARPKIISARGGYHGCTGLALAAGDEKFRAAFGPALPGFLQVPFGDVECPGGCRRWRDCRGDPGDDPRHQRHAHRRTGLFPRGAGAVRPDRRPVDHR